MKATSLYILMRHDGFALMERRRDFHSWVYPGGKIEYGETPTEAMQRECLEETGVIPEQWVALDCITGVMDWDVYPFVVTAWSSSPPERTLDDNTALLHWVQPWVVVKNNGGSEFTYGAVQHVARALVEYLRRDVVITK